MEDDEEERDAVDEDRAKRKKITRSWIVKMKRRNERKK